ncbi:MAG TPA: type II toxin-antitoxin system RelE/ParE family toxin [Solirubrobacteraceae bacterium]|jgi:hypothetical protein
MSRAEESRPHSVIYDPDAVHEFVTAVKSKEGHRSILNAVLKLRELGERLGPPHMKPLQGAAAAGLRELRPKQGQSDWRAIYRRAGSTYVVLAVDRHANFDSLVARAQVRASRYGGSLET